MTTRYASYDGTGGLPARLRFAPLHPPVRRLAVWDWYDLQTPVVVPSLFFVRPSVGDIRGGEAIMAGSAATLLDTSSDVSLLGGALPDNWTGVNAMATSRGVVLDTGLLAGSTASLTSALPYAAFDVAVDVVVSAPAMAGVPVDLCALTLMAASGRYARVRLRLGVGQQPGVVSAAGDFDGGAASVALAPGAGSAVGGGVLTLRFVRGGGYLFGYVGVRNSVGLDGQAGWDGQYSTLVPLIDYSAWSTEPVIISMSAANLTYAGRVRVTISNITFRSQALIAGRPLDNKVDLSARRLAGLVPVATVADLGAADVFFLGLFGTHTLAGGFTYVLPPVLTLGQTLETAVTTDSDPVLKDGQ